MRLLIVCHMYSMKRIVKVLVILVITALTVASAIVSLQPPGRVSENAPPERFSSGRAMKHLKNIAAAPHTIGTAAHDTVRNYIMASLRSLGLEPEIQETTSFNKHKAAVIENIIVRIKGMRGSDALLLASHYDARFLSPGAGDNGSNVAAVLETLRALKYHPALKNDLIILFSDGEEEGTLGSKAFIEESPMAKGIRFALNFDARGSSGRSVMFETNRGNGAIIRELNRSGPPPLANSLMFDASQFLPNYTDFTWFMETIPSGMNFANIGTVQYYHSVNDNVGNFDERTLQSQGNAMMQAVLHFGLSDLQKLTSADVVYFNFFFPRLIIYPVSYVFPLACLATLLFCIFFILGLRKNHIRIFPFSKAFLLFLFRVFATGLIVFLLWKWLGPMHPEFKSFEQEWIYGNALYLVAFFALGVTGIFIGLPWFTGKLGIHNVTAGGLFTWVVLVWITAFFLPGGSYLFVWPLLFSLAGMIIFTVRNEAEGTSGATLFGLLLFSVPGIWIFTQIILMLSEAMTLMIAPGLVVMLILLSATMQIPVLILAGRKNFLIPVISVIIAAVSIAAALLNREPSERQPKPDTMFYTLDLDNGKSRWVTWDSATDAWTSQFFTDHRGKEALPEFLFFDQYGPSKQKPLSTSMAPRRTFYGPGSEIISNEANGGKRILKVRIFSPDTAVLVMVNPESAERISHATLNEKVIVGEEGKHNFQWPLMFFSAPDIPFEITFTLKDSSSIAVRIVDVCKGLPVLPNSLHKPRPSWTIPLPGFFDATLIGRTFQF